MSLSLLAPKEIMADDQIGGSYATIPQIASRKSFRNWYQANYPYSFIGGRVVYDA
jgi:formylglycine-generating enzyme required for sulfatase activity